MWRSVPIAIMAVLLVGGCEKVRDDALPPLTEPVDAPAGPEALDRWQAFPVDRTPRPIILLSAPPAAGGYTSEDAKMAAAAGYYALRAPLPTGPATASVTLDDRTVVLPLITAADAYARLTGTTRNPPPGGPAPVTFDGVALGTAGFATDRGELSLPAWLFSSPSITGAVAWPALADSAYWPAGGPGNGVLRAVDGRTLKVTMAAGRAKTCPGHYRYGYEAQVVESRTAVAVGLKLAWKKVEPGERPAECSTTMNIAFQDYQVTLAEPLGNRVVVDAAGNPFRMPPAR